MPKTGTTAVESVLAPQCDMVFAGDPRVKHMTHRRFARYIVPYLVEMGADDVETACLIREPEDWLRSWYCYRGRPALDGHVNSTADLSFSAFVAAYMQTPRPRFAQVGRQARFVSDTDGMLAVKHLFKYENFAAYTAFLEDRFGTRIALPRVNVSPERDAPLDPALRRELQDMLADEYAFHAGAK